MDATLGGAQAPIGNSRAVRAIFGRARDLARFKPSEVAETTRTIVKHMPVTGFCSTDHTTQPISLPRYPSVYGVSA